MSLERDLLPADCRKPVLWWLLRANVSSITPFNYQLTFHICTNTWRQRQHTEKERKQKTRDEWHGLVAVATAVAVSLVAMPPHTSTSYCSTTTRELSCYVISHQGQLSLLPSVGWEISSSSHSKADEVKASCGGMSTVLHCGSKWNGCHSASFHTTLLLRKTVRYYWSSVLVSCIQLQPLTQHRGMVHVRS